MATTEPVVYGYVGMPIEPSGTPRRGRVRARDIEGAWKHVEARLPRLATDPVQGVRVFPLG